MAEKQNPEEMTPEQKKKQLKIVRRFSMFVGINFALLGVISLLGAILINAISEEGFSFFSLLLLIVGGLLWHSSYLSINSYREMKNFESVDDYITYVKQQREAEEREKRSRM